MGTQKMVATGATVKLCMTRIVTAQISNALKMTKLLDGRWEERRDLRGFVH
jgi:hypothetical protein